MCWLCVAPSLSGLERSRSDREDEGGAERSAAAHGDRGAPPFDGISSMTLAASPCLFSLVSCKRTDGPLARAACASSSCPCSNTSSVSARRACCSRPPWPRPPPHCPRSAGPPPPHRARSLSRSAFPWTDRARSPALAPDGLAPGVHAELVCPALAQPASGLDALGHPCHGHPSDPPVPTARRTMSFRSSLLLVLFVLGVDPVAAACDTTACEGCDLTGGKLYCSWQSDKQWCSYNGMIVRLAGFEPKIPSGIMSAVHRTHR